MHQDHIHIINKEHLLEYKNAVCSQCGKDLKEIIQEMTKDNE